MPLPPQSGETEGGYAKYGPESDGVETVTEGQRDY
jgi:hypothetical protein